MPSQTIESAQPAVQEIAGLSGILTFQQNGVVHGRPEPNAPSWEDKAVLEFFETLGRDLLAAETAAGVKHHVALSVVSTERLNASGYFRVKMAQEELIKVSKIPFTIVRSTRPFEVVGSIA